MENNSNAWGKAVIEKALQYANYEWYATEKNVMHGVDEAGRFVDTPDVTWKGFAEKGKCCGIVCKRVSNIPKKINFLNYEVAKLVGFTGLEN